MKHKPYNSSHTKLARENRKNMTQQERLVRHMILKHRPKGYKRHRQKPLWNYIVDFYCSTLHLVIEIDGSYHEHVAEYDNKRTDYLKSEDIRVVRYTNTQVEKSLQAVADDVLMQIEKREIQIIKPLP